MELKNSKIGLVDLPYDIRFLIYQHLFPVGKQIYLQGYPQKGGALSIMGNGRINTAILRVCRQLHSETTEYLYNNYLFNLVGRKIDCLATYQSFLRTLEKYANDEVHVDAFTNGWHSATMCISIHTGEGKKAMLQRRERGVPRTIEEVLEEVKVRKSLKPPDLSDYLLQGMNDFGWMFVPGIVAVVVALLAWVMMSAGSG